jgi:4-amino-4-deoxy-L-arabinose transferase-like glycosyltransferase
MRSLKKYDLRWLLLITLLGVAIRAYFLGQPMRYDEAYTFLTFVNQSFGYLFYYPLPNNHVLHTLLVKASVELFGSHPLTIRLPAFIAGVLNIPLAFLVAKRLSDQPLSGYFAAFCMAIAPFLILFDTMARGYSLLILVMLLLALGVDALIKGVRLAYLVGISGLGALGLFLMPTFLFPLGGLYGWYWLRSGFLPRYWLLWPLLTALITLLLYSPVIVANGGIESIIGNRFVVSLAWSEWLSRIPEHLITSYTSLTRGLNPFAVAAAAVVVTAGAIWATWQKDLRAASLLFVSLFCVSLFLIMVKRVIPFDRTWIFLLPAFFIALDAVFAKALGDLSRHFQLFVQVFLLIIAGIFSVNLMKTDAVANYPDTGYFPEAPVIAEVLLQQKSPGDEWLATTPAVWPTAFYLWYFGDLEGFMPGRVEPDSQAAQFFVIKPSRYDLSRLAESEIRTELLLRLGDAELHIEQP